MEPKQDLNPELENEMHTGHDDHTKIKYIGGHDYDGIRELDNPLPPWLKYVFYLSIVFAAAYLILLWAFRDDRLKQDKEYQKKMLLAEERMNEAEPVTTDSTATTAQPVVSIDAGKATFKRLCAVCHGQNGEGLVGPNMTDEYWIHGGSLDDMTKIVVNGVIEKGMISFKSQLNTKQIRDVVSYIETLKGTNPPNAKAPQGTKYVPPAGS